MRNAKTDANHKAIVQELRAYGVSVYNTHTVGQGFPDIVCGFMGKNYLFEIKRDKKAKLTDPEERFAIGWKGQYHVITSAYEAWVIITGGQ
jgi:Holliday junction resolvase